MNITNAKIESTSLGYEHGCLSFHLYLDYGDSSRQGFGGYALGVDIEKSCAGFVINKILRVAGVENWEDLEGKIIRVGRKDDRLGSNKIDKIGHCIKDVWFEPGVDFKSMRDARKES